MKRSAMAFALVLVPGWGMMQNVGAGEHRVEGGGELAVAVADQKPKPGGVVAEVDEQVAGLLGDPGPRWGGR
jgi:hypothetical protein